MPSYDIEIRYYPDPEDRFEYDPPLPRIKRGNNTTTPINQITWTCKVGAAGSDEDPKAFAVHFHGASPCDRARYRTKGSAMTASLHPKLRGVCRYKYFVAVVDDNNNVWTDDPDMIVYD